MGAASDAEKQALLVRLRRIEGQTRGLQKMISEDKYCPDILVQIASVRAALKTVGLKVLDNHIKGCVQTALKDNRVDIIDELLQIIHQFTD